ncbi:MAG: Transcriptional regulator, HxlR family [uncultured Rubrobacteraceae bacterium]|uniref:Transcriptional regulator, HxlR family n=1 Tax=uncultured Rubrobacteraceae bacterium TaxID=349277 RepID=A0A6J4P8P5_9ACTN|nr:MAG: Transcriptional regulator, HxlR family [uncultured Rubrobacteraceae bacterium]
MAYNGRVEAKNATEDVTCEARLTAVFRLLGKRWNGIIVGVLLQRPARFGEIVRAIPGLSDRVLSDRLRELMEASLVEREVLEGPPVGVLYRLTPQGEDLRPALVELQRWADRHLAVDGGRSTG